MTFDPTIPVDATFEAFGEPVIVAPSEAATVVTAIRFAPDAEAFLGRPHRTGTVVLEVRAADAASLTDGTVVEIGAALGNDGLPVAGTGERRIVQGTPEATDDLRLTRLVDTRPAPSPSAP